jgi:RNA polymerase sigma factor (sigma-70 family)
MREVRAELTSQTGERDLEGDPFESWVAVYVAGMRRTAARLTGEDAGEDVAQEALVRAWRKKELYSPERGTPKQWLNAITRDQARRWRTRVHPSHTYVAELPEPSTEHESSIEQDLDVRFALSTLPPRQREAIFRFYYLDQSVGQLAAAMGCSPGTVKSTLADGRRSLLAKLEVVDGQA